MAPPKYNTNIKRFSTQALFHAFGSPFYFDLLESDGKTYTCLTPEAVLKAVEEGKGNGEKPQGLLVERTAWYYQHYDDWVHAQPLSLDFGLKTSYGSVAPLVYDGWLRLAAALMLEKPWVMADAGGDIKRIHACLDGASPLKQTVL
jgi:hypothetical protein